MNYTTEQINTILQMLNGLQVTGINNCATVAEITKILQSPVQAPSQNVIDDIAEDEPVVESN